MDLKNAKEGNWLFMGDFNEVRSREERFSEHACLTSMAAFNNFIRLADLVDFSMGGRRFTRMSDDGLSLSKIDDGLSFMGN